MALEQLSGEDITKLRQFFREGSQVLSDMEAMKEGLSEICKALAVELSVKPGELNRALKLHHKQTLLDEQDTMSTIETLLQAAS